ncbi:MAG: hypothetical protein IJ062_01380 [Firmicutes bacterium]|nr:hypothetical protein [Bacillota bacterium]
MDELLFRHALNIVKLLREKKYNELQERGCIKNISANSINFILEDYGGEFSEIDEDEYKKFFRYIKVKNIECYVTYLDLIIDNQRSDLTLICEISICGDDIKTVIDDLHVL